MPQAALVNLHKCFGSLWFLFAIFTKFHCYLILHSGRESHSVTAQLPIVGLICGPVTAGSHHPIR